MPPEVLFLVIVLPALLWLAVLSWLIASVNLRLRDVAQREELHHVAAEVQSKASRSDLAALQAGIERLNERTAHQVERLAAIHDILMKRP
jgi:hypothetical protein